MLSDDLHRPIVGLRYEARPQATRLKVNESLCLSSERYLPMVDDEHFEAQGSGGKVHTPIKCGAGEVLTGMATTGALKANNGGIFLDKSAPRCGVPAGFSVGSTTVVASLLTDALASDDCAFRAGSCPAGTVAVGFQYDTSVGSGSGAYCSAAVLSLRLLCSPYTITDRFKRMCPTAQCSGPLGAPSAASSVAACETACESTAGCVSATLSSGTCQLYSGTCTADKTAPYGRPVTRYPFDYTARWTPVEMEHPVLSAQLAAFEVSKVDTAVLINSNAITWSSTPWSACSKSCGSGVQNRTNFCSLRGLLDDRTATLKTASLSEAIDASLCHGQAEPASTQFCNEFHCDLECRVDAERSSCYSYQQDTRRNAVDFRTRQQACEQVGCCFVPQLDPAKRSMSNAPECYTKPFRLFSSWVEMPYEQCSSAGLVMPNMHEGKQVRGGEYSLTAPAESSDIKVPSKTRQNLCVSTDGNIAPVSTCPTPEPIRMKSCMDMVAQPLCPFDCGVGGECQRRETTEFRSWVYQDACYCKAGWAFPQGKNGTTSGCTVDKTSTCAWVQSGLSGCSQKPGVQGAIGVQISSYACQCQGDGPDPKTHELAEALCGVRASHDNVECDLCDCVALRAKHGVDVSYCNGETASLKGVQAPITCNRQSPATWNEPATIVHSTVPSLASLTAVHTATTDQLSDFVMLEYRSTTAVGYTFPASLAACIATCSGIVSCPGVTFLPETLDGNARGYGSCGIVSPFELSLNPINRDGAVHLLMRLGFLSTDPKAATDLHTAIESANGVWSSELGEKVIAANRRVSKLSALIPHDDPFWTWVESGVPNSHMQQGVSLRKSFFSLAYPVHPRVAKHLRYLKNFFSTTYSNASLARMTDLLLATANKYRYLSSITNTTSTGDKVPYKGDVDKCAGYTMADTTFVKAVDSVGKLHIATRDLNPSPLGAVDWALKQGLGFRSAGDHSITDTPWPLLMKLALASFPTEECAWVHGNREHGVAARSVAYTPDWQDAKKVCKPSNWDPGAVPRIYEECAAASRISEPCSPL